MYMCIIYLRLIDVICKIVPKCFFHISKRELNLIRLKNGTSSPSKKGIYFRFVFEHFRKANIYLVLHHGID